MKKKKKKRLYQTYREGTWEKHPKVLIFHDSFMVVFCKSRGSFLKSPF